MIQYQCTSLNNSDLSLRFYGDGKSTKVNVPLVAFPVGLTTLKAGMVTGAIASDSGSVKVKVEVAKDGMSLDFTFSKAFTGFESSTVNLLYGVPDPPPSPAPQPVPVHPVPTPVPPIPPKPQV